MYMRGVFFAVFLALLSCTAGAQAVHIGGELATSLADTGLSVDFAIGLEKNLSWGSFQGGLRSEIRLFPSWQRETSPWWEASFRLLDHAQLVLCINSDHFTSSDIFRLINKNNYTAESGAMLLLTDQLKMGMLRQVPLKSRDVVDSVFAESVFHLGSISLSGLQMRYAGFSESGSAGSVQAAGRFGSTEVTAAKGWQIDGKGEESQGSVLELTSKGSGFTGSLVMQSIDPNFQSLLAKTNRYTPNRQGWQLQLAKELGEVELSFNVRRHTNREGSRDYNQLSWKIEAKDRHTSLEWRIQPTEAFIMRYAPDGSLFQFDPLNGTLRMDWQLGGGQWSLRLDALRWITRLEYKFKGSLEWRIIAKQDFSLHRSHYSVLIRHSGERSHLQLEIGEYDRGNLGSGFNQAPGFCISWGWKF